MGYIMKRSAVLCFVFLLSACIPQAYAPIQKAKKAAAPTPPLVADSENKKLSRGEIRQDTPQVKVALMVPISGESAAIGKSMVDAASLAIYDTYLNVPSSDLKAQIVLLPTDTGNTPKENAAAAQKALGQGAKFFIGPLFSQSVTAVAPILKEKNISMLSFSNNKLVAKAGVFTFGFLPEQQVERMAEYAYLNKMQRVALLAPNDAYGEKVRDTLTGIYLKKGGIVAPAEMYAPSVTNIEAAVLRIAGAYNNTPEDRRFQAIFIADGGNQMRNIVKALSKSHLDLKKIKIIGAGIINDDDTLKLPELESAWFPSSPEEPYKNFERRFMNTYGYKPVRLASLAYDAAALIAKIAMKGNGVDIAALADPAGFSDTANGLVRLSATGKSDRKLDVVEIRGQSIKVLESAPRSFSE